MQTDETISEGSESRKGCEMCGGPKPTGQGYRVCEECKRKRQAEAHKRRKINKRHPCQRCGKQKEDGSTSRYCLECSEWAKTKPCPTCGGEIKGTNHCATCERAPCPKCGGPKSPGIGRHYCDDCQELVTWQVKLRAKHHRKVPRYCVNCEGLIRGKGLKFCDKCRAKRETRWCSKCKVNPSRGTFKKYCEICYAESLLEKKEYHLEYQRNKWTTNEEWREKELARNRKKRSKRTKQFLRESARIRTRLLRDNIKPVPLERYRRQNGSKTHSERVSTLPLLPYLHVAIPEKSLGELKYISELSGVDASMLTKVMREKQPTLRLIDADSLCIALGLTLFEVYGYDIHVKRGALLDTNS